MKILVRTDQAKRKQGGRFSTDVCQKSSVYIYIINEYI